MKGKPALSVTHPELAAQLLDPDPETVTAGSGKDGNWRCDAHAAPFVMRIARRVAGAQCPYCGRRKVLPGFNDLATTHPDIAATLVDVDPTQVLAGSDRVFHWLCENHSEPFPMSPVHRTKGNRCGYCANVRVLAGFNDLATTHPQLAAQVIGTDPTTVLAGSNTVLQWRCENHDEPFQMMARERIKGHGCGYCAGKKILVGFNDLASQRPDLAAELVGFDPEAVSVVSGKKVTWRCSAHEATYTAAVKDRVAGSGCHYCSGLRTLPGFNDLATTRPDLAPLLVSPDATTVTAGSQKTGVWRCDKHDGTYDMRVSHRTTTSGCPYCSGRRILPGFNDLATTHPQLAAELLHTDPATVSSGVGGIFSWSCPNHEEPYESRINHRIQGNGCPYCSNRKILPGFNDLASRYPELAEQLVTIDEDGTYWWKCEHHEMPYAGTLRSRREGRRCPICQGEELSVGANDLASQRPDLAAELLSPAANTVTTTSSARGEWRCLQHEQPYWMKIRDRVGGRGCPKCAVQKVKPGLNDLATTRPDIAAELVDEDPSQVISGGARKHLWRCPNHPEPYLATVRARLENRACPFCIGRQLLVGFNDLASQRPDLAAELLDPEPSTVTTVSTIKGTWRCSNHPEPFVVSIGKRVEGRGCPYCSGKQVLPGFNDLATVRPDLAAEILEPDPTSVTAGTQKRATWRCSNHLEPYTAAIVERSQGSGCPYCAGKKVLPGFNDLATLRPDLAAEILEPDPTSVMRGSKVKARWRCSTCSREWSKSVRSRTYDHSGCPTCNLGGYDATKAGYLYLMARQGEQQVGITNDPTTRIALHERKGWELLDVTEAMNGERVAAIELAVRRWLKAQGWALSRTHENWSTANLEVFTLRELFKTASVIDPVTDTPIE